MRSRLRSHLTSRLRSPTVAACTACLLIGCAMPPSAPVAASPAIGLAELMERPAERALIDGIRAYDDGQYSAAESALRQALQAGLASPRDRASAHKLLAFITCTSARVAACEAAFRAARAADPGFVLNRSEAGHPQWGPVYRKALP
ncbi:MAG: TssQ family T6SS-associated lipoprotein [Rubrivivax sp.]|nr:TssQ family T6SS-associated lipoprotein [Rubrivivax sp.]